MNQLLPYEQQLADKMQLVPVPDMQDAIWARIEAMLDADVNSQETETTQQITNTKSKLFSKRRITIAAIILAALMAIIINKQKRKSNENKEKPEITVPVNPGPVNKNKVVPIQPESTIKRTSIKRFNTIDGNAHKEPDSLFIIPTIKENNTVPKKVDTPVINSKLPPLIQKKDTIMKKPRGVKGISDSDYRFVMPKKDSI